MLSNLIKYKNFFVNNNLFEEINRINQRDVPGGHVNSFPPNKCKCMWNTVWPACSPSLMTNLYPFPSPSCFAIFEAATIIFPNICSCLSSALETPVNPSLFFGMIKIWVGATGAISLNAKTKSSSYTTLDGISFLISLSNMVYSVI